MSVPLDLSLINQLLNEQRTTGDLNALTKPGFFYVVDPTNKPNANTGWCHVINLVNYAYTDHTAENRRIFQICINDRIDENTVWYRQYNHEWTAWERFVTATELQNSMSTKVNNSHLVADYYNKTDVDALINTINTQLGTKATAIGYQNEPISAEIYDTTGAAHSETGASSHKVLVGTQSDGLVGKVQARFELKDVYPVNTKLTKIAFSHESFRILMPFVPATITIELGDGTFIVATLDADNSDTEFFIYKVPTNLQTETISTGTVFTVYYLQ